MHGGLYTYRSAQEIEVLLAEARQSLVDASSEDDLLLIMDRVIASIGDGHTSTRTSAAAAEFFERQPVYLPLRLRHIGSRTFVEHDYQENSRLDGAEVLEINGVVASEVVDSLMKYTSGDGTIESSRKYRLSDPARFGRLLQRVYGPLDEFDLLLVPPEGDARRVHMAPITGPDLDGRYFQRYPDHYRGRSGGALTFSDDSTIATMRISRFAGDGFPDALERWFAQLDTVQVDALILDLRGNGGGLEIYGQQLIGHLVQEPFRIYARAEVNALRFEFGKYSANNPTIFEDADVVPGGDGRWTLTPQRRQFLAAYDPIQPSYDGPLLVLVDGGTFSTAADVVTALHRYRDAVFLGEEVGGGYYGNTSGATKTIYLPHTKVSVRIPIERYITTEQSSVPAGRGLEPSHMVQPTGVDLRDGRDPVLEEALALARDRTSF